MRTAFSPKPPHHVAVSGGQVDRWLQFSTLLIPDNNADMTGVQIIQRDEPHEQTKPKWLNIHIICQCVHWNPIPFFKPVIAIVTYPFGIQGKAI